MKKVLKYSLYLLFLTAIYFGYANFQKLVLISGHSAKSVASNIFVADRSQASVEVSDNGFSPVSLATNKVDFENKSVTTKVFGLKSRTAVYREGLGTVVTNKEYDSNVPYLVPKRNKTPKNLPFPYGDLPQKTPFSQTLIIKS